MRDDNGSLFLTPAEAACLDALRAGVTTKTRIAVAAGLDLRVAQRTLHRLAKAGLATPIPGPGDRAHWTPTAKGATGAPPTVRGAAATPPPASAAAPPQAITLRPGTSIARLFAAIDRPRRQLDLTIELGISRQLANQNIVRLLALGLLRSADEDQPTALVAPADDPTVLLRRAEARVLSALPDEAPTTAQNLARRLNRPRAEIEAPTAVLVRHGLVTTDGEHGETALTPAGAAHVQRNPTAPRADPWTLPVRSPRVQAVLARLAEAPARTVILGKELGVERHSMNALMQYLKRLGLARRAGTAHTSPHELTPAGHRVVAELARRNAAEL